MSFILNQIFVAEITKISPKVKFKHKYELESPAF